MRDPQIIEDSPASQLDILIIEDDSLLTIVMSLQLRSAGFFVRSAGTGQEALRLIHQNIPSLVILDVGLPGINGYELIEQLRTNPETSTLPLIAHTSHCLSKDQRAQLQLGPSRFVTKSTADSFALPKLIRELVQGKSSPGRTQ